MPFRKWPPLYNVWLSMRDRCRNPNNAQWKDYGGRGIRVCDRWDSYKAFEADMLPRPPGTSIDRIHNDGDYTPENCRWATRSQQQRNQRVTRHVTIEGISHCAADLADQAGLKVDTIVKRAELGLKLAEVISPKRRTFTAGLALGGKASGAKQQARTHCKRGHEFSPENTKVTHQGWRRCRQCIRDRDRAHC